MARGGVGLMLRVIAWADYIEQVAQLEVAR